MHWPKYPQTKDWHIGCRIDSLPEMPAKLDQALMLEDEWRMPLEDRQETLKLAICNAEFLFFREVDSLQKLRAFIQRPEAIRVGVKLKPKEFFAK